jgi:RNA polymerase sigma-70 factor (ECF subfamily)
MMANIPASSDAALPSDFEKFFRENYSSLWRYVARRIPRAKTDDVVSTTFIVAWEKFSTVDNPSLAWLIRVASFEIANARRKQGREGRHEISIVIDGFADPPNNEFDGSGVRSAMSRLSDADQEILRLVLWEELSRDDIAQILGLTVNAVNVRYYRALQKFERSIVVPHHIYSAKEDPNAK